MDIELLAIMGRGIQQMPYPIIDPTKVRDWTLTDNLEVCDVNSAHLAVQVPVDDDNPYCMVGGGWLNIKAGVRLVDMQHTRIVVCAYGHRSDYLASIGAPSESEVMSQQFMEHILRVNNEELWRPSFPEVVVWERTRTLPGPSNTGQELRNIFDLALERGLRKIAIVTVGVHVPRTATYVSKLLSVHERYRELHPMVLESEEVLLRSYEALRPDFETLRASQSFARNWAREADGIQKIVRDVYGDNKPKVVT